MKTYRMCSRPDGSCCPEVTVHDNGNVDVKDNNQKVGFTPGQWETLRMKVLSGEL